MRKRSLGVLALGISLVAVACGGTSGGEAATTTSATTADSSTSTTLTSTVPPSADPGAPEVTAPPSPAVTFPNEWTVTEVARGVKPTLSFDAQDQPAIAYLLEDLEGYIAFAARETGWAEERIATGYFYGPIGLVFHPDGSAIVAYHDHQDTKFDMQIGDLVVATRSAAGWTANVATDEGHDGWDSTVAVSPAGSVHAAGIDPQQFGREDGIQHYVLNGDRWEVTTIGSGPIEYEWNVSLAITPDEQPALTYFDNNTQDLRYAELIGGNWSIETVVEAGDVGRFSSLAIDDAGTPHISFYERTGETTGIVRYATRIAGTWVIETVGELDDVSIGFTGARRITSLALHPNGAPVIAYSDLAGVFLATRGPSGWVSATVVTADDFALGQQVDLGIDSSGTPHLATYKVTSQAPLDGIVVYLTPAG